VILGEHMMNVGTESFGALQATAMIFLCANGEVPAENGFSEMIPCQAVEDIGSTEGVETRDLSSNNNDLQERPTSKVDEDIVRHSGETRRVVVNSLRKLMLDQVPWCGRQGHTRQWRPHGVSCGCKSGEYGETPTDVKISEAIPCQATEDIGSVEGVETRGPSSNGNDPHERPTSNNVLDEDIVRHSVETRRASLNSLHNRCANTVRAAHGNVIATETMNKTMFLLQQLENALFFGDSSILPEQIDGIEKLITDGAPQNVIDLRGEPLTEDVMNDLLLLIRDNFGTATDGYFSTGAFGDLAKQVYDRQRFTNAPAPGTLGSQVTAFQGQHGKISLHDSIFIQPSGTAVDAGLGNSQKRPAVPTLSVPAAVANPASLFKASDAGTYIYRVVAANRFGKSVPVDTAGVAVVAGDRVSFTITDSGNGTQYYEVYRTGPGGAASTAQLIRKLPRTGASEAFTDDNEDIPGTSKGFVLMQNQQSFSLSQLLPMTRIPLAAIDTSIRWAQVLYVNRRPHSVN